MSRSRRGRLTQGDEILAIGLGTVVGLGVAYLVRVWLSREPLDAEPRPAGSRPRPGRGAARTGGAEDAGGPAPGER